MIGLFLVIKKKLKLKLKKNVKFEQSEQSKRIDVRQISVKLDTIFKQYYKFYAESSSQQIKLSFMWIKFILADLAKERLRLERIEMNKK